MARLDGTKEKVHGPCYDCVFVNQGTTLREEMNKRDPRAIRFFVDVQNKTRLETNLQSAGVLPSLNLFEARALRIIVSPLKHKAAEKEKVTGEDLLSDLIYNSVTSLEVGDKSMIEMPTFWFPSGAGVVSGSGGIANHGQPDPLATFRFAEPVQIARQQNFQVEMAFPQGIPERLAEAPGPYRIWCVLDGYLTRDVQ